MKKNEAIGIFDSGLGGLTVASAIHKLLPNESIIYFGDTLHMPYGDKSAEEIIFFCEKIASFLIEKKVKMLVIACNTASAVAASYLRKKFHKEVEIQGVIRPILQEVIRKNYKSVGIIGTEATVRSGIYHKILREEKKHNCDLQIFAAPMLAPMIENDFNTEKFDLQVLYNYLKEFHQIEVLLLACTHYPLVKNETIAFFNNKVHVLDNSEFMAKEVEQLLKNNNIMSNTPKASMQFYVSKMKDAFTKMAQLFFGEEIIVEERNIFAK